MEAWEEEGNHQEIPDEIGGCCQRKLILRKGVSENGNQRRSEIERKEKKIEARERERV